MRDQRLEGPAAGRRAERRRPADRPGEPRRCRRRASRSAPTYVDDEPAGEHRRSPEPGAGTSAREGLDRHAHGLEGTDDVDRAGRDEPRRRHRRRATLAGRRASGAHRQPGDDRPDARTASCSRQKPARRHAGAARTRRSRSRRPASAAPPTHDDDRHDVDADAVTRRLRVALLAGGRSSEHDISLASARSVLEALDPERYEVVERRDRPRRPLGARQPARRQPGRLERSRGDAARPGRAAARSRRSATVDVVLPDPARARSARTARCRACSSSPDVPYVGAGVAASALAMDKDLFKKVHARQRHPGRAHITHPARRPGREPVRLPGVRQAGAARLVGRHLEGARRGGARRRRSSSRAGTTRRCSSRSSSPGWRSSAACSATAAAAGRVAARARSYTLDARVVRLSRRSTTRAGWSSSSRRELPQETIELRAASARSTRSSRASARAWRASTSSSASDGEVLVNELNTIPGFTATSVYAKLFEASGDPVRGAARPADRARARAARAPLAARVLALASRDLVHVHDVVRAEARDPDDVVARRRAVERERRLGADGLRRRVVGERPGRRVAGARSRP